MTNRVQRRLFLHADTDKAILVSATPLHREAETKGGWLPRSQVEIINTRTAYNPNFGKGPGAALIWGTVVDLTAPGWLLESRKMTEDAPVPDSYFDCPDHGRCPHGTPLNHDCNDCRVEHGRATA